MNTQLELLFEFIKKATTPYHAVLEAENMLKQAGFEKLQMSDNWRVKSKGKYYVVPYDSMMVAFTVPNEMHKLDQFKIIASHTDSPCFKLKSRTSIATDGYIKLNTEVYGGPVFSTWFDRPLSLAGKVALRSDNIFKPVIQYVDFKKPLLVIPNQPIHLNRKVNEGIEINPQKDLLPLFAEKKDNIPLDEYLNQLLAKQLDVKSGDILEYDLFVYLLEEPQRVGLEEPWILSPRLDNLAMVYSSINALIKAENSHGINIAACFDNEEIGSRSIQGADSDLLSIITERILIAYDKTKEQYYRMLDGSLIISADAAHAIHPNAVEKYDETNRIRLNQGIAFKTSASKRYASDCESIAILQQLCQQEAIPCQKFANRSDQPGGMTLGPIVSQYLPIKTVDMGLPMLAMHSSKEMIGCQDFINSLKLFEAFYKR